MSMKEKKYNREKVVQYAKKWAYERNPKYYNYDNIGGDCTNFISQCIFAGSGVMNYTKTTGWYYKNANDKSPSWTGVEYLHKFLVNNKGAGPVGIETSKDNIEIGDIAQLSFDGNIFAHSLVIIRKESNDLDGIYIATHTFNAYNRKISSYQYKKIRFIHIDKVLAY